MKFSHYLTLGPIGYMPAGGTLASLVTLPLVALLQYLNVSIPMHAALIVGVTVMAFYSKAHTNAAFVQRHDPSEIVIDEVIGCLIAFSGIVLTPFEMLLGLLLFRFFDITKLLGIKQIERIPGMWGIILDDVAAGLYTFCILHVLRMYGWL